MMDVVTIGLDLAKNVFQVHGVDADGGIGQRCKLDTSKNLPNPAVS
jgi:transposase